MREPVLPSFDLDPAVELNLDHPADPASPATNRAARRGKASGQVPASARYRGSAGHSRPAQGRRINPVRRTG